MDPHSVIAAPVNALAWPVPALAIFHFAPRPESVCDHVQLAGRPEPSLAEDARP